MGRGGEVVPFRLGLGVPLGWGGDGDGATWMVLGTDLGVIPRGRGGILHCRRKIFSIVVSVLFRGKCVQLWGGDFGLFLVRIWLVLGI